VFGLSRDEATSGPPRLGRTRGQPHLRRVPDGPASASAEGYGETSP